MLAKILWLAIAALVLTAAACNDQPAPAPPKNQNQADKNTPEQKAMIEKVLAMKPEVNTVLSTKTLGEVVQAFSENKGSYNIKPLGWEASQRKDGKWKILFHYLDYNKVKTDAEWAYDPATNKVYPFDPTNSPQFYSSVKDDKSNSNGNKAKT